MTTPTQTQIEAAAKAMEQEMFAPHELPLDAELHDKYLHTAEAALTAAAEAGGQAEAEIERLRAALKTIAEREEKLRGTTSNDYEAGYKLATEQCSDFAREALNEQVTKKGDA